MRDHPNAGYSRSILTLLTLGLGLTVSGWACGSNLTEPEILTLFIAPQLVECQAVGPQTCMQVRERPDEEWKLFYAQIEGFEFVAGFFYEIRVEKYPIENPPADGSRFRYVLVELVSKVLDA